MIRRAITLSLAILTGCATSPAPAGSPGQYRWAETDLGGNAPGQAYAAAAMFPRVPMPDRREFRAWEFYFKHCARVAPDRPYVSKTQYDCNGPY